jgi:hypothetical protein
MKLQQLANGHPQRNPYLTQIINTHGSLTRLWIKWQEPLLRLPRGNPTLRSTDIGQPPEK